MTQVSQTYNVVNKEGFLEKLGKLTQRYKVEFEVTWAEPYKDKIHPPHGDFEAEPKPLTIWYFPCEVIFSFAEFKIEGYSYLGAIRDNDMMGLITIHGNNLTDGLDLSSWVKGFESIPCHKCNRKHKRTVGHLFREDKTGNVNVYGSGCAKKYFGIDFDRILGFFETINLRYDEWFEEDYHRINRFHIDSEDLLKRVYFVINKYGYVSKTKADNYMESTAEFVAEFLESRPSGIKIDVIEKTSDGIDFSILWNKSYVENENNKSNFDHNIEVIQEKMKYNHLTQKDYGWISFMVWNEFFKPTPVSRSKKEFILPETMEEGDRIGGIRVTLAQVTHFEAHYGRVYINVFESDNIRFKWFSATDCDHKFGVGKQVVIHKATIKSLDDNPRFGKSVIITRATIHKGK